MSKTAKEYTEADSCLILEPLEKSFLFYQHPLGFKVCMLGPNKPYHNSLIELRVCPWGRSVHKEDRLKRKVHDFERVVRFFAVNDESCGHIEVFYALFRIDVNQYRASDVPPDWTRTEVYENELAASISLGNPGCYDLAFRAGVKWVGEPRFVFPDDPWSRRWTADYPHRGERYSWVKRQY